MTSLFSFSLIAVVIIIFTIGYFINYADGQADLRIIDSWIEIAWEHLPYTFACQNEKCFPVYYLETTPYFFTQYCNPNQQACHVIRDGYYEDRIHTITYLKGHMFDKTMPGCNIWTHENLHAWGYNEGMIRDFFDCNGSKYKTLPKT